MALIKCPECGKEISDLASNCPNCGFPIGFDGGKRTESNVQYQQNTAPPPNNSYQQNSTYQQTSSYQQNNTYQQNVAPQPVRAYVLEPEKNSGLGVAALVFSILGITFFIGIILAVIDLCRKDGRKKFLSIASLCVCAFWLILAISVGGDSNDKEDMVNTESQSVITTQETQQSNVPEREEEKEPEIREDNFSESTEKLQTGTYVIGEDIDSGKYNFYASKGTGTLKIYKSYEDFKNDEYGFDAFREFDMLTDGASVGLLNEDVYTDTVYNIRLSDGWCIVIDKGLELKYKISEKQNVNILSVGIYIAGEDIDVGKYDFTAIGGSGSVKIYNSYNEYLEDKYGFDAFSDYDMKESSASVGMLNEDVYTESINNIRIDEGQCLIVEKGLKLEYSLK